MAHLTGLNPGASGRAAGLDWMQMLSGLFLALFMLLHTFFIASVIFGAKAFDSLAGFFESTYLAQIGGVFIGLVFLFHFVLAARKIPFTSREQAVVSRHALLIMHADTWMWVVQAVSGMLVLLMGSVHMWVLLNDLPITAEKSVHLMHQGLWVWFYLLFVFLVFAHLGAGIYRIGVKWGFIRRFNRAGMKKGIYIATILFILLDLVSLCIFYF